MKAAQNGSNSVLNMEGHMRACTASWAHRDGAVPCSPSSKRLRQDDGSNSPRARGADMDFSSHSHTSTARLNDLSRSSSPALAPGSSSQEPADPSLSMPPLPTYRADSINSAKSGGLPAGIFARLQMPRSVSADSTGSLDESLDEVALLHMQYLTPAHLRKGKGGRQPALDPRLDPGVEPRKAKRILANRLSAARSKMKQKSEVQGLTSKLEAVRGHKARLSAAVRNLNQACQAEDIENKALRLQLKALQQHSKIQTFIHAKLATERELLLRQRATLAPTPPQDGFSPSLKHDIFKAEMGAMALDATLGGALKTEEAVACIAQSLSLPPLAATPLGMPSPIVPEDFSDTARANVPLPHFQMIAV